MDAGSVREFYKWDRSQVKWRWLINFVSAQDYKQQIREGLVPDSVGMFLLQLW